jgi:hypothetical protein
LADDRKIGRNTTDGRALDDLRAIHGPDTNWKGRRRSEARQTSPEQIAFAFAREVMGVHRNQGSGKRNPGDESLKITVGIRAISGKNPSVAVDD